MSEHRRPAAPSTLQLVVNHLALRLLPAAVVHAWLSARRAGADRRRRTPALVLVAAAALAVGLLPGSGASAQSGPPSVAVSASPTSVRVAAPGPLAAGATRFVVERSGEPVNVYFALLNTGVPQAELEAALAADDRTGGDSSLGLVSIKGSVSLYTAAASRAVTFTLRPGLTYLVMAESEAGDGRPARRSSTTFTTAAGAAGADAPAPAATVRMQGLRFRGASVLPQRGVLRMENRDGTTHIAVAFPLRRGVTNQRLGRALRGNSERAFGRLLAGAPYPLQTPLSGGNTANDVEVDFARPGRYGLVCFVGEHQRLGMHRVVTVR